MTQLKVKPIDIEDSGNINGIVKNIKTAVSFVSSVALDINRVIAEFNEAFANVSHPYDDADIKKNIERVEKSIKELDLKYDDTDIKKQMSEISKSIPASYDDTDIKKQMSEISKSIPASYDDTDIKKQMSEISKSIPASYDDAKLKEEMSLLNIENKKISADLKDANSALQLIKSMKKEIESNRKEAIHGIDNVFQELKKINKFMEV